MLNKPLQLLLAWSTWNHSCLLCDIMVIYL